MSEQATKSALQQEAEARVDRTMDTQKAEAEKQKGMAMGAAGKHQLVAVARRKAMEIGQFGPLNIDDVTEALRKSGLDPETHNNARSMWKGSVFRARNFLCIGSMQSRIIRNHARDVKMWVTREWLGKHSLNGTDWNISAFRMMKIYRDFKRANPNIVDERCNWIVGTEELSDETRDNIVLAGNMLYGIPVTFVPGSVGALLQPPTDYVERKQEEQTRAGVTTG